MLWLQHDHFDFAGLWENVEFELLATYDVVAAPGWSIEQKPQEWNEIWLLRSGSCELCINSQHHQANAGDVVVLSIGQQRITSNNNSQPLSLQGFSFRTRLLGDVDFLTLLDVPTVVSSEQLSNNQSTLSLQDLLSRAIQESRTRRADSIFAIKGLLQLGLTEVLRAIDVSETSGAVSLQQRAQQGLRTRLNDDLVAVLQLIAERYDEPLDVAALARAVHLSPKHFARKFRTAIGIPPMEYLRRHRLQQAALQLAAQESVSQIAARCGFDDAAHFSRAFKAHFGTSPNVYRAHLRSFGAQSTL